MRGLCSAELVIVRSRAVQLIDLGNVVAEASDDGVCVALVSFAAMACDNLAIKRRQQREKLARRLEVGSEQLDALVAVAVAPYDVWG